jgi:hypothetical protein
MLLIESKNQRRSAGAETAGSRKAHHDRIWHDRQRRRATAESNTRWTGPDRNASLLWSYLNEAAKCEKFAPQLKRAGIFECKMVRD